MFALIQSVSLDTTTTYVSVGGVVLLLGLAIRITQLLTKISEQMRHALEKLAVLEPLPGRVSLLEQTSGRLVVDVDELWGIHRGGAQGSSQRRGTG